MELIVDANILFSFFKPESFNRDLIKSLYIKGVRLFIPDFGLDEVLSLKARICDFCGIDESEFEKSFTLLYEIFDAVPKHKFENLIPEARKLLPEHTKDIPYFALALSLNCGIWSNEKRFKKQSNVKIFSTDDLLKILKLR
ncbi:MAG: PIN domain-containing protein [Nanoarchaeota archaeon]|nr:PIN domain-containing protein [Nanoarchaeota archaeon]